MEEEHGSEDGLFAELAEDGELLISDKAARARLKEIKGDKTAAAEVFALNEWLKLAAREIVQPDVWKLPRGMITHSGIPI
ncbi:MULTISPECIES: hypothetical protein [Sphingomonas]|nr:hypothetical protein [Sphingomonas pseudosanguinis]MBN3536843.1 hypothetical protein [Sphingomonas pseudosanguinis]